MKQIATIVLDWAEEIIRLEYPTYDSAPLSIATAVMRQRDRIALFLQAKIDTGEITIPPKQER